MYQRWTEGSFFHMNFGDFNASPSWRLLRYTRVPDLSPHVSVLWWGLEVPLATPSTQGNRHKPAKGQHWDELTPARRKKTQMLRIGDELTGIGIPGKPCLITT